MTNHEGDIEMTPNQPALARRRWSLSVRFGCRWPGEREGSGHPAFLVSAPSANSAREKGIAQRRRERRVPAMTFVTTTDGAFDPIVLCIFQGIGGAFADSCPERSGFTRTQRLRLSSNPGSIGSASLRCNLSCHLAY